MKTVTVDERWIRNGVWVVICGTILAVGFQASKFLVLNGPEAAKLPPEVRVPSVRAEEVKLRTIDVELASHGEVSPLRRTTLTAEVGGKLISVSDSFEAGEVFQEGDLLLQIDSADYDAALAAAEAKQADAALALVLEQSRRGQALRDWAKLGNGQEPGPLVKREPQMASAEAAVKAAQGAVEKARRDVERTSIRAPYDCRIEQPHVDLGAVLAPGTPLVVLVSRGAVEVRLALTLEDYGYLKRDDAGQVIGAVTATAEIGGKSRTWTGAIVRSEEIVDRGTRSLNVVAEFGHGAEEAPLIGMFVKTIIEGISIPDLMEVPRAAMLNGTEVLLVNADGKLEFRPVEVMRTERDVVIVTSGLKEGERVVVTPPSAPAPGAPVKVIEAAEEKPSPAAKAAGAPES